MSTIRPPLRGVHQRCDLHPECRQAFGERSSPIGRREHDGPLAGSHGEAFDERSDGPSQHHAWTIVPSERDRPLVQARREDDPTRPHVPDAFAASAPFVDDRVSVVVEPEHGRVGQYPEFLALEGELEPVGPFVDEHDAVSAIQGRPSGRDARRSAADDQGLHVRVPMFARHRRRGSVGKPAHAGDPVLRPDRPPAETIVAATTGSIQGLVDADERARLLDARREHAARAPQIGDRHTTSTPFASSADASVSPANPVSSRPSNENRIGVERSITQP